MQKDKLKYRRDRIMDFDKKANLDSMNVFFLSSELEFALVYLFVIKHSMTYPNSNNNIVEKNLRL